MMIEEGIRKLAANSQPGERVRGYCPFCHADDEKSFSVVRDKYKTHLLWFKCFRGKCGEQGRVVDEAGVYMVLHGAQVPEDQKLRPMPQYGNCSHAFLQEVEKKYGIPPNYLLAQAVRYDPEYNGLVMPWLNEEGEQFGWVHKNDGPKSKHDNVQQNESRLAFPLIGMAWKQLQHTNICVLVEDLLSAYRICYLAQQLEIPVVSVALNGAHINKPDVALISSLFDNVVVLLDYDQWPRGSMGVLSKFYPQNVRQIATTLHQDPKDAPEEELQALLMGLPENF
jgi:hypothetical protein